MDLSQFCAEMARIMSAHAAHRREQPVTEGKWVTSGGRKVTGGRA